MRCPVHGEVDDPDETSCPQPIRRTIAGEVVEGRCGMPLEERW